MEHIVGIKVGSNTLTENTDVLQQAAFDRIARQVIALKAHSDVVLISSGAMTAGAAELGVDRSEYRDDYNVLSTLAAVGQTAIMRMWHEAFDPDYIVAQHLVTPHELTNDLEERQSYIAKLLQTIRFGDRKIVPIVNENDAISHEEIKIGENARLSALVMEGLMETGLWSSGGLVMLTDVDGLYDRDPGFTDASLIRRVEDVSAVRHLAGGSGSNHGTGGMAASIEAAQIATKAGVDVYIANGSEENAVEKAIQKRIGTYCEARSTAS